MSTQLPEHGTRRGRPSKGDRQRVVTRIATPRYAEFKRHVETLGADESGLVERILTQWLDEHREDLERPAQAPKQQVFDLEDYRNIA